MSPFLNSRVLLECCPILNRATLLPDFSELPIHTCKEALEDLMLHFSHMSSIPLNNPDFPWYIDGNSSYNTRVNTRLLQQGAQPQEDWLQNRLLCPSQTQAPQILTDIHQALHSTKPLYHLLKTSYPKTSFGAH